MGFFSRLLYTPKCRFCGGYDFKTASQFGDCKLLACKKCWRVDVYYKAPICAVCGKVMRSTAYNHNDVAVPKCANCGHLWDADERGWYDLTK